MITLILHDSPLSIALDDPGPELSYAVNVKDGDDGQAYNEERDGDGGGPEDPLVLAHVADVGCIHAE